MFSPTSDQIDAFHNALNELAEPDCCYTSFAFFLAAEIDAMIQQTSSLLFRTATAIVGNNVHQDMEVCFPAPRQGVFDECATLLETLIHGWSGFKDNMLPDFQLNDFAVQKYGAGSKGIGIHKDGLRYKNLVMIITLSGESRLFYTDKREDGQRIAINDTPGRIVLLKATEFGRSKQDMRALHGVDNIKSGRLSIGFRYEA